MQRAAEQVTHLINYEQLTRMRLLSIPKIEKIQITKFMACPSYDKAIAKLDQKMERYHSKVESISSDIRTQEARIEKAKMDKPIWVSEDSSSARINEHNRCVEIIQNANEKRNDLIDKKNEAIDEANEKLQELRSEALTAIDDDIVGALDKCNKVVEKLSRSQNSEDLLAAMEIVFLELKVSQLCEDHIEGNGPRKDARDRIAIAVAAGIALCKGNEARNSLVDLFRRNTYPIELLGELNKTLASTKRDELVKLTTTLDRLLAEAPFQMDVAVDAVLDLGKVRGVMPTVEQTIKVEESHLARVNEFMTTTYAPASAALEVHKKAEGQRASLKAAVEALAGAPAIRSGHFLCEMFDEKVIDDVYSKELRAAVAELRTHLANAVGADAFEMVASGQDLGLVAAAAEAVKKADLSMLQRRRDVVPRHLKKVAAMIENAAVFGQLLTALAATNQGELTQLTSGLDKLLGATFPTSFTYRGVVDPAQLESVIADMKEAIAGEEDQILKLNEYMAATEAKTRDPLEIHQKAELLYASMKKTVDTLAVAVGEDAASLRAATGDPYLLGKGAATIEKANVLRFQQRRDKVQGDIVRLRGMIASTGADVASANEVPRNNAAALTKKLSTAFAVSWLPFVGIVTAAGVPKAIKTFEPAFRSSVDVYQELGDRVLKRTAAMTRVMIILAAVFGVGGAVLLFALSPALSLGVKAGVPGAALALYGGSGALFSSAGKRLASYLKSIPAPASSSVVEDDRQATA